MDAVASTRRVLAGLVAGRVRPEVASRWAAMLWESSVDHPAGEVLLRLTGADARRPDGSYRYGVADFQTWLAELGWATTSETVSEPHLVVATQAPCTQPTTTHTPIM